MNILDKIKGYRTIILNLVLLATAVFGKSAIPIEPEQVDAIMVGVGAVANIGMRFITTTPVGVKSVPDAMATVIEGAR